MFDMLKLTTNTALALDAKTIEYLWQTPLIGIFMVFAVLAILWGVLSIFKFIFAKPSKPVAKVEEAPIKEPEIIEETTAAVEENNDDELIAVITAAVAAYIENEEPDTAVNGFRVVSFRRTNGGRSWNTK